MSRTVVFNHFPRLARELEPAADAAARAAAERLADDIQANVRVRTGELRESISVAQLDDGYDVGSSADQALSEEIGTSRQAAHPTFAPAAEGERPRFVGQVRDELHRRLR